jgi:hypothetical protein
VGALDTLAVAKVARVVGEVCVVWCVFFGGNMALEELPPDTPISRLPP